MSPKRPFTEADILWFALQPDDRDTYVERLAHGCDLDELARDAGERWETMDEDES